jgi:hypothetical protein
MSLRTSLPAAVAFLSAACSSGTVTADPTPAPETAADSAVAADAPEPVGGHGPAVTYKPVRGAAYRIERHDSLDFQFEGGATQQQVRDRIAFVRLTLAPAATAGAYQVSIVLDSLQAVENGAPASPDSLAAANGARWTATLTTNGRLSDLKGDRSSLLVDEVAGRIPLLFPALPSDGVQEGMQWTDTTKYEVVTDAFPGSETAVVTYEAKEGGSEPKKSISLESSGSYSRSGTRMQADQELQMTASGQRQGVHRLGLDGTLISAQGRDTGEMTISVPAVGQNVPVKQSGSYTITSTSPGSR